MKKISILLAIFWLFGMTTFAQDEEAKKENNNKSLLGYFMAHDSKPERFIYESGYLIDNQTCITPVAKTLEMVIQHRFGTMENGISDVYGIFGAANTRLGLNYGITDWLQIGFGSTKNYKLQDFGLKVNLIQQSRDKKIPVSVTYYGNWAIDARAEKFFGENYKFSNRFSFFNEVMVTRKFADWVSITLGGSFTHFNKVAEADSADHDKISMHFLGRFKVSQQSSIIINCDLPLKIKGISEWTEFVNHPEPNIGIGWEIATMTHAFQVFLGTATYMVPQYNVMKNDKKFFGETVQEDGKDKWIPGFVIGFNITRLWNF